MINKYFSQNINNIFLKINKKDKNYYYKLFNLKHTANEDLIKSKYKEIVKNYHPDKIGENDYFKEVNKAYKVWSNIESKKLYDEEQTNFNTYFKLRLYNKNIDLRIIYIMIIISIYYIIYLNNKKNKDNISNNTYNYYRNRYNN